MRRAIAVFVLFLAFLPAALAEDVKVRLFHAHPPNSIEIHATGGVLRWKKCSSCEEQSGPMLLIESNASGADGKNTEAEFLVTGRYELRAPGAPSIAMEFPLDVRSRAGALSIVVAMPLEIYVEHALMAEGGDFKNDEAMKAMAVTVRTYAEHFRGQHAKEGFDFCDTTHCQVVHWKAPSDRVREAVAATAKMSLTYQGSAAATYYHQNCGGTTAAASEAWNQVSHTYLPVHSDPFCTVNGGLTWETGLTHEQINRALQASGIAAPQGWRQLEIRSRTKSGRAQTILLDAGGDNGFSISASSFRFAVNRALGWNNIRSDLYDVRNLGGKVLFSGRGAGHGVGLCQAGAEEMARQGKNFREILAFYFPGTQLSEAKPTPSMANTWQKRSDERFDLFSAHPDADAGVLASAERILRESEDSVGWKLPFRPRLQVFANMNTYRDTTGQPGWVAASTRGHSIRLQPLAELRQRGILESTLRHELTHLLVEAHAKEGTPPWFREGLVLFLSGNESIDSLISPLARDRIDAILAKGSTQEDTRRAYQSAHRMVRVLIQTYGKEKTLSWLSSGLPADALADVDSLSLQPPGH